MREYFRPFSQVKQSTAGQIVVTLSGTNGESVYPNYITVEASGDTASDQYYNCYYSPDSYWGSTNPIFGGDSATTLGATGTSVSGIIGQFAPVNGGICTFSIPNSEKPTLLIIKKSSASEAGTFFITYGNVMTSNNLADQNLGTGV